MLVLLFFMSPKKPQDVFRHLSSLSRADKPQRHGLRLEKLLQQRALGDWREVSHFLPLAIHGFPGTDTKLTYGDKVEFCEPRFRIVLHLPNSRRYEQPIKKWR